MGGVRPQVNYIKERKRRIFKPLIQANVGDVVYWNGKGLEVISLDKFKDWMGTPIGVCVVPTGFASDGKARMASLYGVDTDGNKVSSNVGMVWGPRGVDTSLTNYNMVPTTDNNGSTSTGSNGYGYLPSDAFTSIQSFVDSKANYKDFTPYIPSPYLGDKPNSEYYKELSGNNVLSDFSGPQNTQTLVNLSSEYIAANACWRYNDGSSNLQWYLPAMGELGFVMPRFNEINNTINSLGGFAVASDGLFWSSSEHNGYAYRLVTYAGNVNDDNKDTNYYVRPFSIID